MPCDGEWIASEGLCLRHAVLFDVWIAECGGHRVYGYSRGGEVAEPTVGSKNPADLRAWKRRKFLAWLDTLTPETVASIEAS